MKDYQEFVVGGTVRDQLLGVKSKDIDYTFVFLDPSRFTSVDEAFEEMHGIIEQRGEIFLSTPECVTIRYKDKVAKDVRDVVLSRKEIGYIKGTRQPEVVLGTLYDDLTRRDFTINAMAMDIEGNIVDYFNGQKDLQNKILRTPLDTAISFNDDPLRILRGMRFAITKGMDWSEEMWRTLDSFDYKKLSVVSTERKREELYKCFKFDTRKTIEFLRIIALSNYPLYEEILPTEIWLEPTTKQ